MSSSGFPRLYAAASLKLRLAASGCRPGPGFPRLYAAASLKRGDTQEARRIASGVFRGFMPRPH